MSQHKHEPNILEKTEAFYEQNKNIVLGTAALIVIIIAFFIYRGYQKTTQESEALPLMALPEQYFAIDSFNLALYGDGLNPGFLQIVDDYGRSSSAELAKYYAGICFMNLNDYQNAINYLESFSTSSEYVQARAYEVLGHANAQMNDMDNAIKNYKKAAGELDDKFFTPYYLQEVGDALMSQQKYEEALSYYERIKEEYPESKEGSSVDGYIQFAKEKSRNS
jgi:tetratricopeptide (TPR) repeat protein